MGAELLLVDTSAWIDFIRHVPSVVHEIQTHHARAAVCGAVKQEILQGSRNAPAFGELNEAMSLWHYLPENPEDFVRAAKIYSALRPRGITLPPQDCLIAAVALRHGIPLFARDKHFSHIDGLKLHHTAAAKR